MDPTTRRLAAIGLAIGVVSGVYAIAGTTGTVTADWIPAVVSLVFGGACLLWGFWPRRAGNTTFKVQVTQAAFKREAVRGTLYLTLLLEVHNDTDVAVTVRPTDLMLIRVTPWREEMDVPAQVVPRMGIDPMGRVADYSHFPEGQYTIPARSERSHYFFFEAEVKDESKLQEDSLKLKLTVCLPGPRRSLIPLPPITFH